MNFKNLMKQLEKNGRDKKIYLNIIYFLATHYFLGKNLKDITVDDLEYVYDNLEINNELLDIDNYNDYDMNELKITKKNQQLIKDGKRCLLLNYYKINESYYTPCKIFLDAIYDRLVY